MQKLHKFAFHSGVTQLVCYFLRLFLQRWELFVKITHLLQKILQRRSLRFVTAAKMDSPVHFGQKRRANPDGAINLPRAYFVTLKISLQNFGKSFWRKLKKHRQNKPLPVLSPFTALLSPCSRGSKGVKRVKWGFPDIYEVKSVSRWQGQIIEGMKWDCGRVNRWGWWFSRTVWNCDHRWLARCRC